MIKYAPSIYPPSLKKFPKPYTNSPQDIQSAKKFTFTTKESEAFLGVTQVSPLISQFLTEKEKSEIVALKNELESLEIPKRPPGAFMLYKADQQAILRAQIQGKGYQKQSTKDFCVELKKIYEALP